MEHIVIIDKYYSSEVLDLLSMVLDLPSVEQDLLSVVQDILFVVQDILSMVLDLPSIVSNLQSMFISIYKFHVKLNKYIFYGILPNLNILLLCGQKECLRYKSLLDPSRANASTQIWLFSFESKCFHFRLSSLLPKWKEVIILAPGQFYSLRPLFFLTGAPLDCNQIWKLFVHL